MERSFSATQARRDEEKVAVSVSSEYLQTIYQRLSLITVLLPLLGTIVAIALLPFAPIGISEVALFIVFYILSMVGVEVGYHRYFSHRSFQANKSVQALLAILGSMAAQGGVIFWVAHHRRHHQYTDQERDPHSPHLHGDNFWGQLRGFWHAHLGWVLEGEISNSALFAKDLLRDPLISSINRLQQIWVLLGLLLPAMINGLILGTWIGFLQGLLWGGLVRIFVGQQVINATNSICHMFGSRPFQSGDQSTNNVWLAIPSIGQSWHNNHHAFPSSAVTGLEWWQIDIGTWFIRGFEQLNLVTNVKRPSAKMITNKLELPAES
ncbi:MAG: acyl-CoA desaturase [Leptolyngbyaceae cyanobacterium MAG.088]|nr:acyl-CoA desaturase [Leptolyngbyaceae cyanobacterium MAG.088]